MKDREERLGRKIESAIRKACYDFSLLEENQRLAIALSGGKDSLTLLHFLHKLSGTGFPKLSLIALYVGGPYSCGAGLNPDHLASLCASYEVPFVHLESQQRFASLDCYPCSRDRRKLLFEGARAEGCSSIAFGHHRDDSIETLLMNLLHKGEFAALLPKIFMECYEITTIRPLIYVTEREIREFARKKEFLRISCRCPVGERSKRRQVKGVLSQLEELFPHAASNLARAAHLYGSNKAAQR